MTDASGLPTVVVKVGGSLLDMKDLAARLRGLFLFLEPARIALVAGGGPAADVVRRWDEIHGLGDQASHWLAIRAMGLTEELLAGLLPECSVVSSISDLHAEDRSRPIILAMERLIREAERGGAATPPASWNVTSDTLAAWGARHFGARQLVLAKSVDVPEAGLAAAQQAGLVDSEFARAAGELKVAWVNLRADVPRVRWLQ